MKTPDKVLASVFREVLNEIRTNADFRDRISHALGISDNITAPKDTRPHRRKPGPFDPMTVYRREPASLRGRLEVLTTDELKDMIAEHGMDRSKLAMKWKENGRLIDLIITTVESRAMKGDAFRGGASPDVRQDEHHEPDGNKDGQV